jgi:hypothetical protein
MFKTKNGSKSKEIIYFMLLKILRNKKLMNLLGGYLGGESLIIG